MESVMFIWFIWYSNLKYFYLFTPLISNSVLRNVFYGPEYQIQIPLDVSNYHFTCLLTFLASIGKDWRGRLGFSDLFANIQKLFPEINPTCCHLSSAPRISSCTARGCSWLIQIIRCWSIALNPSFGYWNERCFVNRCHGRAIEDFANHSTSTDKLP